jgi:hypothetical protein
MQIKPGRLHAFAGALPQPDPHVGFVGAFVLAETNVSVNLKQAFIDLKNGVDLGRDWPQLFAHLDHKFPGRVQDILFVILTVVFKPLL